MCSFRMIDEWRYMSYLTLYLAAASYRKSPDWQEAQGGAGGAANLSMRCLSNGTKVGGEYKQP